MSKILDGICAWLAASHGSTLEDVVINVVIIIIINMGCQTCGGGTWAAALAANSGERVEYSERI